MVIPSLRMAATVVLLRDTEQGLETLLLRRNDKLAFAAGAWVFPGGCIDQTEFENTESDIEAARVAAVREVYEECGLVVCAEDLLHFCNWTTPEAEAIRFSTWFFVSPMRQDSANIVIDGSEIHGFQWIGFQQALDLHHRGELELMLPTYLSIRLISHYPTVDKAYAGLAQRRSYQVTPRLCEVDDLEVSLYPGDAGYLSMQAELPGPRHRSVCTKQGMNYIHSGEDVCEPAMDIP